MPTRDTRRNVWVFGVTSFLNDTASEMAYWILPAFLRGIGAGPGQLGIIEGIAESMAAAMQLVSGRLADRFSRRKPFVIAGYTIANLAKPLLAIASSWWHVLFIRFADRTSKGLRSAPRDVLLSESVPKERLGAAFGLQQAMDSAGAIAGPVFALAILAAFAHRGADQVTAMRTVFWAAALPGALTVLVFALLARETRGQAHSAARGDAKPRPDLSSAAPLSREFYKLMFAVTLFSLGASSDMFLILRAQEAGIGVEKAPLLGLVFNTVYTLASWPAGRLSDRVPKRIVAAAGYGVYALTYAVFAWSPSRPALWTAMACYGFYYALSNPVLRALVAQSVSAEARGRALGVFYFATSAAMLLSSVLTGVLWKRFGGALPLAASSVLAAVAAALLLLFREKLPHREAALRAA